MELVLCFILPIHSLLCKESKMSCYGFSCFRHSFSNNYKYSLIDTVLNNMHLVNVISCHLCTLLSHFICVKFYINIHQIKYKVMQLASFQWIAEPDCFALVLSYFYYHRSTQNKYWIFEFPSFYHMVPGTSRPPLITLAKKYLSY